MGYGRAFSQECSVACAKSISRQVMIFRYLPISLGNILRCSPVRHITPEISSIFLNLNLATNLHITVAGYLEYKHYLLQGCTYGSVNVICDIHPTHLPFIFIFVRFLTTSSYLDHTAIKAVYIGKLGIHYYQNGGWSREFFVVVFAMVK